MQVYQSPTLDGFYWVVDNEYEVIAGPFFYAAEAQEKKEELEDNQ